MARQFDAFESIPGLRIDSTLTLGENLADLGGLVIVYAAFRRARQGALAAEFAEQFMAEQHFFLSYTETWRFALRPETLRARLVADEHAPLKYRVLDPLATPPECAAVFQCRPGHGMIRPAAERVDLWWGECPRAAAAVDDFRRDRRIPGAAGERRGPSLSRQLTHRCPACSKMEKMPAMRTACRISGAASKPREWTRAMAASPMQMEKANTSRTA